MVAVEITDGYKLGHRNCLAIHKVSQKLPKRKRFKVDPIAHMRSNLDKMYKEFKAQ